MTLEMFMDMPVNNAVTRMKICTKCNTPKPATPEYFYRDKNHRDGLAYECKECKSKRQKAWMKNGGYEKCKKNRKEKSPHRTSLNVLRGRVKRKGKRKFLLGESKSPEAEAYIKYLETITHCTDCSKELVWHGANNPDSASFDRIDSAGDYTKENVRVVCKHCNVQKNDLPIDEWVAVLERRIEKGIIEEVYPRLLEFLSEEEMRYV